MRSVKTVPFAIVWGLILQKGGGAQVRLKRSPSYLSPSRSAAATTTCGIAEHIGGRFVAQPTIGRTRTRRGRCHDERERGRAARVCLTVGCGRPSRESEGWKILLAAMLDREDIADLFPPRRRRVSILVFSPACAPISALVS